MSIRNRVVRMEMHYARDLMDHEKNWRTHPAMQKDALRGGLTEIGITGALIAYYSARAGGKLVMLDGHARKDVAPDTQWPVLITDLDDEEADKELLIHDPIGDLAGLNADLVAMLAATVTTNDAALREVIRSVRVKAESSEAEDDEDERNDGDGSSLSGAGLGGPAEMELLPFEHCDYILVCFKTTDAWMAAAERLGLRRETYTPHSLKKWEGQAPRIGLSHVISGETLMEKLK